MSSFNPFRDGYKRRFKNSTKKDSSTNLKQPIIYNNHTIGCEIDSRHLYPNLPFFYQAAFIDPGIVSCAIRIVRFFPETGNLEVLWFGIHNFGTEIEEIMKNTDREFEPIALKLQYCHHILIEHQFKGGGTHKTKVVNYRAFQHLFSYIQKLVKDKGFCPVILEVDVKLKTTYLGGPSTERENNGVKIKEWSKKFARDISLHRRDYLSYCILEGCAEKQNEDLSDTLCYEYAWWTYLHQVKHLWQK